MVKAKTYGNKIYQYAMPPLPDNFPLPPLPPIPSKKLRDIALTHTSFYGITKETHDLDTTKYIEIQDYEKLEFLGDKVLSLCVDLMVHEVFPGMRQGVASMMHDQLVRNDLLAQLSEKYGIVELLRTSHEARYAAKMQTKIKGSIFESYIAGVFYAHLEGETPGIDDEAAKNSNQPQPTTNNKASNAQPVMVSEKGKKKENQSSTSGLMSPGQSKDVQDSSKDSDAEEKALESLLAGETEGDAQPQPRSALNTPSQRTYGEAFDHTYKWLKPLFRPILDLALKSLQEYQKQLEEGAVEEENQPEKKKTKEQELVAGGAACALNIYCENTFGNQPEYHCERSGDHLWKITCTVITNSGEKFVGEGIKKTKKMARSMATYEVGRAMKLFR